MLCSFENFKKLSLFLFKIFMVLKKTGGFIYFSSKRFGNKKLSHFDYISPRSKQKFRGNKVDYA